MFKSSLLLSVISALLLASCIDGITGGGGNDDGPDPQSVPTYSIESVDFSAGSISFDLVGITPNPCWTAATPTYEESDKTFRITLKGYPSDQPCISILGSIESSITLNVTAGTEYTFEFWRFDEAPLDTTITIPQF